MRILVIGGTGTIGSAVAAALEGRHDVVTAGRTHGDHTVDLADPDALDRLYDAVGAFDAVVCAAGQAAFDDVRKLSDDDMALSVSSKLMGQVNVVRRGLRHAGDAASFTLTSGILARAPVSGSAAVSLVNAGVEAFARAAVLDLPDALRINVVSPPWVSETLEAMGRDPSDGMPAADVARAYVASVEGDYRGQILDPRDFV